MTTKSKALTLVLCSVVLVTAIVAGTLAWLTSEQEVKNTFTVGNVKIILDEADVDEDGETTDDSRTDKGNKYHLIPGKTYIKDPRITVVKGSEESYVRMLVTINKISELEAILGTPFLPEKYVTGWDANVWQCVDITEATAANTATYEFRYTATVDASEATADVVLPPLFEKFTLPGEITGEELQTIKDLEIIVKGNAIQASGFATADAAWAAFEEQAASLNS